jgi:hypothetical protein
MGDDQNCLAGDPVPGSNGERWRVQADDQYHVGIVVEDLDNAKAELAALAGYVWGPQIEATTEVRLPSGSASLDMALVYSVSVPRIELVRQIRGTMWEPAAGSGVHHLGYWSDDVAADAAHLESQGYAHEASGLDPDGKVLWSFHRSQQGPRIELVSRTLQAQMSAMWAPPS